VGDFFIAVGWESEISCRPLTLNETFIGCRIQKGFSVFFSPSSFVAHDDGDDASEIRQPQKLLEKFRWRSCKSVHWDGNLCPPRRVSNIQQLILTSLGSLTDRLSAGNEERGEKKSHQKFIPLDHYLDYANTDTTEKYFPTVSIPDTPRRGFFTRPR
jgi:hypothetical protein